MYREIKEFVITPVGPVVPKYKYIADAIRRGCKKAPEQCYGRMFGGWWWNRSACALGAAYHGGVDLTEIPRKLRGDIAWHNDIHQWTRERIADWLETLVD